MAFYITVTAEETNSIHYLPKHFKLDNEWEMSVIDVICKVHLDTEKSEIVSLYCNLIEHSCINGSFEPLLGQFIVNKKDVGIFTKKTFQIPQYLHLVCTSFDSFSLQIKPGLFKNSKFIIKLHFRPLINRPSSE